MIEHMNKIDALNEQIMVLLDLMIGANKSTDVRTFNTAAEMCMTMQEELKDEVDKIFNEWREQNNG